MKKTSLLSLLVILMTACSVETHKQSELTSSPLNRSSIVQRIYDKQPIPDNALFSWSANFEGLQKDRQIAQVNMDELLQQSIINSLIKKGYRFNSNTTEADYTINYTAGLERNLPNDELLQKFGAQPGLVTNITTANIEKGTLVIDVYNQKSGQQHWRSIGQAMAQLNQIPKESRQKRIDHLVNLMLTDLN